MSPSSPVPRDAVNISSKLRRNSLVSEREDMLLLREKLTRIAVGAEQRQDEQEPPPRRKDPAQPFQTLQLLPERPSTPPSSPQPRDVLRRQLRLKQRAAESRRHSEEALETLVSVDEVDISPMEVDVQEDAHTVHSPPPAAQRQARLSIPGHLRVMAPFSVLNKYPEGLRKRKSAHVDDAVDDEPRVSLKKTSSQINILATSAGTLSRSSSASGDLFQTFAARRHEDQDMEDAGCTTQPQSPQNALFGKKQGRLSACS
ncbi:unnamed protein product [Phytophthora lilii]|uniref:Unnamed protein product n=1 Tax=Phytophthora lilii TaxID=2077276 RepID=A0A9W7CLX2_9STRA|nr:unnamed protein product [Phytophthora lilii]